MILRAACLCPAGHSAVLQQRFLASLRQPRKHPPNHSITFVLVDCCRPRRFSPGASLHYSLLTLIILSQKNWPCLMTRQFFLRITYCELMMYNVPSIDQEFLHHRTQPADGSEAPFRKDGGRLCLLNRALDCSARSLI